MKKLVIKAFKRAIAKAQEYAAAERIENIKERLDALGRIEPYKSRGKGRSHPFIRTIFSRREAKARIGGKTYPRDGKREMERHARQMLAVTAGHFAEDVQ